MASPIKKNILVTTSAFPRWQGDQRDIFIYELCKRLASVYNIYVLVPRDKYYDRNETYDNLFIYKHNQSPFNILRLAYGSGIIPNLKKNPFLIFIFPFYVFNHLLYIKRLVRKYNIDFIHSHWAIPGGLIAVIYKKLFNKNIKLLLTCHGADLLGLNFYIGNALKKYVLKNVDLLSVVSNHLKQRAVSLGYNKQVYIYPMGIDTNLFTPSKKGNIFGSDKPIILFVGIDYKRKGLNYLIQAMPNIIQKYPFSKLVIIGESNQKSEMEIIIDKLNITKNIVFLGAIPYNKLPEYFASADIFVLPSLSEGFGLVLIEAMSCGTITIASDLPPFHDFITDEQNGFYTRLMDSDDIANKISYILNNETNLVKVKLNARQFVVNNFDWEIVSKNYITLLNE